MYMFIPLFIIYFVLAFYGIGIQDLEVVELLTSEAVQRSWSELLMNRLKMGHPPFYFLATKAWMVPLEFHQLYLYSLVILVGSLGIPIIYYLAHRLGMGKWSWVAALFWSLHPAVLYYARYMRPQIVVLVLYAASLLVLLKLLEKPTWKQGFGLLALGIIGATTSHLLLFFWISIIATSLLVPELRKHTSKPYWCSLSGVLGAQIGMSVLVKSFSGTLNDRLEWIKLPSSRKILETFIESLSGISAKLKAPDLHWVVPLIAVASFVWVLVARRRKYQWNLLLYSVLISVLLFLGMTFTVQPLWVPRYLIILIPVMILVVTETLRSIPSQKMAAACVAGIAICSLLTTHRMIEKRNFGLREMVLNLEEHFNPETDAVIVLNIMSKEALARYSAKEYYPLVVRRKFSEKKAMKLIDKHLKGKSRLWVLEFPKKNSILRKKSWQRIEEKKFVEKKNRKLALHGYQLGTGKK